MTSRPGLLLWPSVLTILVLGMLWHNQETRHQIATALPVTPAVKQQLSAGSLPPVLTRRQEHASSYQGPAHLGAQARPEHASSGTVQPGPGLLLILALAVLLISQLRPVTLPRLQRR